MEPRKNLRLEDSKGDGGFRIVSKEVWDEWIRMYGGGPEIVADGREEGALTDNWMVMQPPLPSPIDEGTPRYVKGIEELSVGRLDSIGIGEGALEILKERTKAASQTRVLEEVRGGEERAKAVSVASYLMCLIYGIPTNFTRRFAPRLRPLPFLITVKPPTAALAGGGGHSEVAWGKRNGREEDE